MKIATLISSAALALVAVTGVASAQSTVPGSDYYRDARADARANAVIMDQRSNDAVVGRSYGYAAERGTRNVVPGSDYYRDARADARANSVIQGTRANAIQENRGGQTYGYAAPSVNGVGAEIVGRSTVPGSDYYIESRADARANSVVQGTRANDVIVR